MQTNIQTTGQPSVVLFIHPGREYRVNGTAGANPVEVPWVGTGGCGRNRDGDCPGHTRRFVAATGDYVDKAGKTNTAVLGVWSEWEGASIAKAMPPCSGDERFFARWVHSVKSPLTAPKGRQNTDPCVFGDTFKYCCCHQTPQGRMRTLVPGSLILFGTHLGDRFVLDTVFVTDGKGEDYDPANCDQLSVSENYRELTLRRLGHGSNTFYRGKTYQSKSSPFSFTPAKLFTPSDYRCGERFVLDIPAVNRLLPPTSRKFSENQTQGFSRIDVDASSVLFVWKEVLRQVRAAGFLPAVHFDWPN